MINDNNKNLLCWSCKKARRSNGKIFCTTIGTPELVMRYGNNCRRYESKQRAVYRDKQPSLFAEEEDTTYNNPLDICPHCIYFVAGTGIDPDICFAEPNTNDLGTDSNGVIRYCRFYKPTKIIPRQ